jgi:hypothetical protein
MASELRVDTLKDSSGNNSVGMSYVAEGSAKVWLYAQQRTATVEVKQSFNVSSWSDDNAGSSTTTFTNAMSSAEFNITASNAFDSTASGSGGVGSDEVWITSSSTIKHDTFFGNGTEYDCDFVFQTIHGDLA